MVKSFEAGQARNMLESAGFTMAPVQEKSAEDRYVESILGVEDEDAVDKKEATSTLSNLFKDFKDSMEEIQGRVTSIFAGAPKEETEPELSLGTLVAKYEAEGMNRESATLLANQTLREAGLGTTRTDTGTGQPGISVSGQPAGTAAGTTGAVGTTMAGDSTTAVPIGRGAQAQPSALTFNSVVDNQPITIDNVPPKLFELSNKVKEADEKANVYNAGPIKRNATMAFRRYYDASQAYLQEQGLVTGDEKADATTWMRFTEALDKETERKVAVGESVIAPVIKGKPGRKPAAPEQQAEAKVKQNQMAGASRDAARDADRAATILAKDFNADDYATDAEAMDAAQILLNDQRAAIDTLYEIANSPAHRNNKAGKTAKAALANIPAEETALAKERAEARKAMAKGGSVSGTSRSEFGNLVDHSQFLNSDGYAQSVDIEITNPQETQLEQVGGQRRMLPEKKRKAKWY
jgi:hypothetical protein